MSATRSRRTKHLALASATAAVALSAWWFVARWNGEPTGSVAPNDARAKPVSTGAALSSSTPPVPLPEVPAPATDAPRQAARAERSTLESTIDALVRIRAVSSGDRVPLADVKVYVDSRSVPLELFWRYCGGVPGSTNERGEIDVRVPARRAVQLQVRPPSTWKPVVADVGALAAGSRTEREIDLESTMRVAMFVRAVDAESDAPIETALARKGRYAEGAVLATADPDGVLLVDPCERGDWLRIEARGCRTERVVSTEGHASRESAVFLELEPGGTVHATVLDRGTPARGLTLRIGYGEHGERAETAPNGSCTLEGLPVGQVLHYDLLRDGDVVAFGLVEPPLQRGELRELEIRIGDGARVRGRLLDPAGVPLGDERVQLVSELDRLRADERFGRNYDGVLAPFLATGRVANTSADGAFVFEGVSSGAWVVSARGNAARARHKFGDDGWCAAADRIVVSDDVEPPDVLLQLREGLAIEGVVLDDEGEPLGMVSVDAEPHEIRGIDGDFLAASDVTSTDGSFSLAPLRSGRYSIRAHATGFWYEPMEVDAGATGVRLQLEPSERVRVRVLDDAGVSAAGNVALRVIGDRGRSWSKTERSPQSDAFEMWLPVGVYTFMAGDEGGRFAVREGIRVSAAEEVVVDLVLEQGGRIVLSSTDHADAVGYTLMRGELLIDLGFLLDGNAATISVPVGECQVYFSQGGEWVGAQAVAVDPGQTVTVTFEPS